MLHFHGIVPATLTQIQIDVKVAGKSKVEAIQNVIGGTASVNGNIVTITVERDASSVEFDVIGSQCHLNSVTFVA